MLKTAVVILNWNGEAMLRRFLPTLIRCTDLPDTALYVADNGSTDNSISLIKNDFPDKVEVLAGSSVDSASRVDASLDYKDGTATVKLPNVDAQVVKIVCAQDKPAFWWSVHEIEIK